MVCSWGSVHLADNLMLVNKNIVQTWTNALANNQLADVELQVLAETIRYSLLHEKHWKPQTVAGSQFFLNRCVHALVSLVMSGSLTLCICIHLSPIMCLPIILLYFIYMSLRLVVTGSVRVWAFGCCHHLSSVKNFQVRKLYGDETWWSMMKLSWAAEVKPTSAEACRSACGSRLWSSDRGRAAEDDFNLWSSWGVCFRGSSAEVESTYQSSAEAETVVAEAARKTVRETSRIRREWHRGFRHRSFVSQEFAPTF